MQLMTWFKPAQAVENPFLIFSWNIAVIFTHHFLPQELSNARSTVQTKQKIYLPTTSLAMVRRMKYFTNSLPPRSPHEHTSRRPWASLGPCVGRRCTRMCPNTEQPAQWLPAPVSLHPRRPPSAFWCTETSCWSAHWAHRELKQSSSNLLYSTPFQEKEALNRMKSIPVTTRSSRFSANLNFD